jgi:hypothetical protein
MTQSIEGSIKATTYQCNTHTHTAGANIMMWYALPSKSALVVSSTSSAAWLGMYFVGIFFPRLKRKPLEVACLTPFVLASAVKR